MIENHNTSKKVIFFTNIIAPYRVFLFNELESIRKGTGFDFEVFFMRETESNREWKVEQSTIEFKYEVGNGIYFKIKSYFGHFNPILIYKIIKTDDEIILGASWNNLNAMFLVFLKSFGIINNKISVWSEANYLTNESQKKNKIRDSLRKWFFSKIDGSFILPGEMAKKSFEQWNLPIQNIIIFPNLVDDKLFTNNFVYNNTVASVPKFFIVARLEEEIKGLKNFMVAVGNENLKKIILSVAGTGSSMNDYKKYVMDNELTNNVLFLGNLSQDEVSAEYKSSDAFILPSFSDPSPLTIVEAIYSGLPVLISNRCGNHFETVYEGVNGYIFNPLDHHDTRNKFEQLLKSRERWEEFSKKSNEIANDNFNVQIVLKNLIKKL